MGNFVTYIHWRCWIVNRLKSFNGFYVCNSVDKIWYLYCTDLSIQMMDRLSIQCSSHLFHETFAKFHTVDISIIYSKGTMSVNFSVSFQNQLYHKDEFPRLPIQVCQSSKSTELYTSWDFVQFAWETFNQIKLT